MRRTLGLIAALALAAVATALVSQHVYGLEPCPWCVLQRLLFLVVGLGAGLAAWAPAGPPRRLGAGLAGLAALGGVAAALYQNLVAARSSSCNLTLADKILEALHLPELLPSVFEVRASCADAAASLLGLPYELWSAALFAVLGALAWRAALTTRPR